MTASALIGLLIAAQAPQTLVARADEAGAAYIQCLFAVVREANAVRISQAAFEQRLSDSCQAEQQAHRALAVRVLARRGESSPQQSVDRLDRQIRQGLAADYRTLPQKTRMLERLKALCAARPDECR